MGYDPTEYGQTTDDLFGPCITKPIVDKENWEKRENWMSSEIRNFFDDLDVSILPIVVGRPIHDFQLGDFYGEFAQGGKNKMISVNDWPDLANRPLPGFSADVMVNLEKDELERLELKGLYDNINNQIKLRFSLPSDPAFYNISFDDVPHVKDQGHFEAAADTAA